MTFPKVKDGLLKAALRHAGLAETTKPGMGIGPRTA
jgi:hypothetical protein